MFVYIVANPCCLLEPIQTINACGNTPLAMSVNMNLDFKKWKKLFKMVQAQMQMPYKHEIVPPK